MMLMTAVASVWLASAACHSSDAAPADTCECGRFEACVGGDCLPADTLLIRLAEGVSPHWKVCPVEAGKHGTVERAQQGQCAVLETLHEPTPIVDADFGSLTVSGTLAGPILATAQRSDDGCFDASEPVDQSANVFEEGSEIIAEAAGGAHFPAFSSTVRAPGPIFAVTAASEVQQGQDLVIAWVSSKQNEEIVVRAHSPPMLVHCEGLTDNGNFTVPGQLTSFLPIGQYDLIVSAVARQRLTPAGSDVAVELQVQSAVAQQPTLVAP